MIRKTSKNSSIKRQIGQFEARLIAPQRQKIRAPIQGREKAPRFSAAC